jgi:GTP pyrophosphokinase
MANTKKSGTDWKVKYEAAHSGYETFRSRFDALLRELIEQADIDVQVLESRTKTPASFAEKISRPGKDYANPLDELPDLVGLRVTVYYTDDIARVENILRSEFEVHPEHSSDKQQELSPNEFGYLSVHHVVSLKPPRTGLAEWNAYASMKAEVQIRTVLQHAWAAVSHALQYKHETDVPVQLKRKLFRLAGLFELADEQFLEIRDAHTSLVREIAEQIERREPDVALNVISLRQYIESSPRIQQIVVFAGSLFYDFSFAGWEEGHTWHDYISQVLADCASFGIKTLGQLDAMLKSHGKAYEPYLRAIQSPGEEWTVDEAFVLYLILIQIHRSNYSLEGLLSIGWAESIAKRVLKGAASTK